MIGVPRRVPVDRRRPTEPTRQGSDTPASAHALLEHAPVADDDEARSVVEPAVGQDAGAKLGADAGAVAEEKRDRRELLPIRFRHVDALLERCGSTIVELAGGWALRHRFPVPGLSTEHVNNAHRTRRLFRPLERGIHGRQHSLIHFAFPRRELMDGFAYRRDPHARARDQRRGRRERPAAAAASRQSADPCELAQDRALARGELHGGGAGSARLRRQFQARRRATTTPPTRSAPWARTISRS